LLSPSSLPPVDEHDLLTPLESPHHRITSTLTAPLPMTINPAPQKKRRHRSGPGFTLPAFSEKYNIPIGTVRRAVRAGQITTVAFGGRNLITPCEADRIATLFSLKVENAGENNGIDNEGKDQERKD
jgi:hypothetical protein